MAPVSPCHEYAARQPSGVRRRLLVTGLTGRVIEVGAGDGANFAHYPADVSSVLAVEPEPYLRRRAEHAATLTGVPVQVTDGLAEDLPAEDGSFDAAVVSLVLCSVTDQPKALREMHRVLRPGGRLRFFEHVRADGPAMRRVQRLLDATVWPALFGGCHTGADTATAIEDAGFRIEQLNRPRFPDMAIPLPTSQHMLGTASRL
ncbi:MAG: class I SAM-dependent methyltransferase [Jiangellaceae bacterium]